MLNPYEAYVTINDKNGNNALNTLDVQIQDPTGEVIGQGQIFNGSGYVSANGYSRNDEVIVLGNDFYYRADRTRLGNGFLEYHHSTGTGPAIEVEKQIVTYEMNFVVDSVWNYVIQPVLPKMNDFTLSSDLQNLLNLLKRSVYIELILKIAL